MDYDAENHIYSDGGQVIPSVTQLLGAYFHLDSRFYAPGAAERWTRVHELCASYASGARGLALDGYATAFADWAYASGAEFVAVEKLIEGQIGGRRYAGRLDLVALIRGRRVLVDLKTGAKAKWHHAQLAAYARAEQPHAAMVLYLSEDGTYRPEHLTAAQLLEGLRVFRLALEA
jgi:hypothetical protein